MALSNRRDMEDGTAGDGAAPQYRGTTEPLAESGADKDSEL